jgi:predicted short-subunit dehydrogenase-like oxidoreductase (DUF2520 family)
VDLVLIGAGRVGTAVATLLQSAGHHVAGVASRSPDSAQRASDLLGAPVFDLGLLPAADVALLGVPATALESLGGEVADRRPAEIVCHFAGAVGIAPLRAVTATGVFAAALHPVQTCPDIDTALRLLPGSAWGVTTSPEIAAWAHELITADLHGFPIEVAEANRALWHAAAVTTANGTAALLTLGEAILTRIGVDRPADVLGPLAAGTVTAAAAADGAGTALTGPVVRGEAATVGSHVQAFSERAPELLEAYRLVARTVLLAAEAAGRVDDSAAQSILRALEG